MKFINSTGLKIDFDPTANLEVQVRRGTWCSTSPEMFRSWGGLRRINGRKYAGAVYNFLTNNVVTGAMEPSTPSKLKV